jgi:hypothetical protein
VTATASQASCPSTGQLAFTAPADLEPDHVQSEQNLPFAGPELGLTGVDTDHAGYDPHPLSPMEARMNGKSKTLLWLLLFNGLTAAGGGSR